LLFPILLLVSLPSPIEAFLAGIFGILFSLTGFALHHLMKYDKPTILTQIGALFIFIAGFLFNLMLMVQLTFKGYLENFYLKAKTTNVEILDWITKTVDPIHLGMQFSNDFFTAIAMILFSVVMIKNRFFGKIWGLIGILIGVLLLIVKCYTFPLTTQNINTVLILGPLIAIWFTVICIQCL